MDLVGGGLVGGVLVIPHLLRILGRLASMYHQPRRGWHPTHRAGRRHGVGKGAVRQQVQRQIQCIQDSLRHKYSSNFTFSSDGEAQLGRRSEGLDGQESRFKGICGCGSKEASHSFPCAVNVSDKTYLGWCLKTRQYQLQFYTPVRHTL